MLALTFNFANFEVIKCNFQNVVIIIATLLSELNVRMEGLTILRAEPKCCYFNHSENNYNR